MDLGQALQLLFGGGLVMLGLAMLAGELAPASPRHIRPRIRKPPADDSTEPAPPAEPEPAPKPVPKPVPEAAPEHTQDRLARARAAASELHRELEAAEEAEGPAGHRAARELHEALVAAERAL